VVPGQSSEKIVDVNISISVIISRVVNPIVCAKICDLHLQYDIMWWSELSFARTNDVQQT